MKKFIIAGLVVILLLFLYDYIQHLAERQSPTLASKIVSVEFNSVLVIKLNPKTDVSEDSILKGDNAIIGLRMPNQFGEYTDELIGGRMMMMTLDQNQIGGTITSTNNLYSLLDLRILNKKNKARNYVSFSQAGIRALSVDIKSITEPNLIVTKLTVVGEVVMSDNSVRLVYDLPILPGKIGTSRIESRE